MGLRSNSIPRSIIALLGGRNQGGLRTYVFYKDGEILVVEAPPSTISDDEHYDQSNDWELWDKEYNWTLEKIQTAARTMEFGKTNWAYMIPQADGGCRIIQKDRLMPKVACPTWAPLVDEDDIVITKWNSAEDREGLWKGREVDLLLMGWDTHRAVEVEQTMKAYRLLQGLDLTFEVLGHVVRDGQVVGLMTEPAVGRMVEPCDRALVFDAISRVESRGLLYWSIHCSNIMISGGKVRLLGIHLTRYYSPEEKKRNEKDFQIYHWKALEIMFDFIRQGNFLTPRRTWPQNLQYIPSPIPPEFPRFSFIRILFLGSHPALLSEDARKRDRQKRTSHSTRRLIDPTPGHVISTRRTTRSNPKRTLLDPYVRLFPGSHIPSHPVPRAQILERPDIAHGRLLLPSYDSDATSEGDEHGARENGLLCLEGST